MKNIKIVDIVYQLGEQKFDAKAIAERFNMDSKKLQQLTGIQNLYKFDKLKGNIVDRLVSLIHQILEKNNLFLSDIDGIFGSGNHTGPNLMPTMTTAVAAQAGFKNIKTQHVAIGCAGGVQAVESAYNQLIIDSVNGRNRGKYYLVIEGEDVDITINQNDYKTGSLFSDSCYVLIMTNSMSISGRQIEFVNSMSLLGDKVKCMTIKNPLYPGFKEIERFHMNGRQVYVFGVKLMDYIKELTKEEYSFWEIKKMYLIPHQANLRMIEKIIQRNKLSENLVHTHGIRNYGNTSNSSAFIGLADSFHKKEKIIVAPFGAELQVGVIIIK